MSCSVRSFLCVWSVLDQSHQRYAAMRLCVLRCAVAASPAGANHIVNDANNVLALTHCTLGAVNRTTAAPVHNIGVIAVVAKTFWFSWNEEGRGEHCALRAYQTGAKPDMMNSGAHGAGYIASAYARAVCKFVALREHRENVKV